MFDVMTYWPGKIEDLFVTKKPCKAMSDPLKDMTSSIYFSELYPRADYVRYEDKDIIWLEVAGYDKENIEISLRGNSIFVSGNKEERKIKERDSLLRGKNPPMLEIKNSFNRQFLLNDIYQVDINNIEAKVENGMLEIVIPRIKQKETESKKILIK